MINDFKRKNVRLIVICLACVLAALLVYVICRANGLFKTDAADTEDTQMNADLDSELQEDMVSEDGTALNQENDAILDKQTADESTVVELSQEEAAEMFKDKTVSILGDSISTYEGWIPDGHVDFFPIYGELTDIDETWWKMLIDDLGMQFCANSSSAGSTCVGDSLSIDDPKFACSNYRIDELIGKGGVYPDIIIVYMGTNDLLTDVVLGENDGTQPVEEGDVETFSDAYTLILDKLESQYPGAQIFCCTLTQIGDWGDDKPFKTFVSRHDHTSEDYSRQIELIAESRGFGVIDLFNCGIVEDNMSRYTTDGVHLNPEGMKLVYAVAKEALIASVY